ncbi:MAG: formylglycine-generating enzyme family protein [Gammaproteobacteria bacterium]
MKRLRAAGAWGLLLSATSCKEAGWASDVIDVLGGNPGNAIQSIAALVALITAASGIRWWRRRKIGAQDSGRTTVFALPLSRNLEEPYYAALADECDRLPLGTVLPELGQREHGLSLSKIYQDQRVRLPERDPGRRDRVSESGEALPLMQALARLEKPHWVVRGRVGTGKSSFINYLTYCIVASRARKVPELPQALSKRPVARLLLRETARRLETNQVKTESGFLWDEIKASIKKLIEERFKQRSEPPLEDEEFRQFWEGPSGFKSRFESQGILLLDGLDEAAESEEGRGPRGFLRKAIEEFSGHAKDTLIIVTSRPHSYERDDQRLSGFPPPSDLEAMTEPQIREFIREWYVKAPRAHDGDPAEPEERAERLAREIFGRDLQNMAETPLLLTLFIGLDYCGKRLPSSRAELYKQAIDLLLQRWHDNLKGFRESLGEAERHGLEVLAQSPENLVKALERLAYATYRELSRLPGKDRESLAFSEEMVLGHLCKVGSDDAPEKWHNKRLREFLQFRCGVLVAGRGDGLEFPHRAFHEYLAASHLVGESNWKEKIKELLKEDLDWWREVFLLLVKKYSDTAYGDAVLYLHHGLAGASCSLEADEAHRQRLLLLAGAAGVELAVHKFAAEREDARQFHGFLQTSLVAGLRSPHLEIAERAESGRLLADLGDPRRGITVIKSAGALLPDIDWQEIPAGTFRMGSEEEEGYDHERPAHEVALPRFFMSRAPVTNAQYRCFVEAGMYQDRAFWYRRLPEAAGRWLEGAVPDEALLETIQDKTFRENYRSWLKADSQRAKPRFWQDRQWNLDNHPVVGVSWFEALAYAAWLNDFYRQHSELIPAGAEDLIVRLPIEAEWEYAARGVREAVPKRQGWRYAFGDDPDPKLANYKDTGLGRTSAVGLFPAGLAFGLDDLSGNVWEWTLSRWGRNFERCEFNYADWQKQDAERNLLEPVECRIVRGGSWAVPAGYLRSAFRNWSLPADRGNDLGFRLALGGVLPGSES